MVMRVIIAVLNCDNWHQSERPPQLINADVRDPDVTNLSFGTQISESTNGFLKWHARIRRMELIQIEFVRALTV